jgi:hypothetical protein
MIPLPYLFNILVILSICFVDYFYIFSAILLYFVIRFFSIYFEIARLRRKESHNFKEERFHLVDYNY